MSGYTARISRYVSFGFAAWLAAQALWVFAPPSTSAQSAKPAAANKAPAPWKFRLEEARIEDIHRAIKSRQITCEQLVQAYINRIRAYDGQCVAPVNPNDANDPKNLFPDVAKYTGTPLQPGVMQATVSDPTKQQTYGYIRGVKNAGQLRSLSTVNIRGERSATCKATCDLHPSKGPLPGGCSSGLRGVSRAARRLGTSARARSPVRRQSESLGDAALLHAVFDQGHLRHQRHAIHWRRRRGVRARRRSG